MAPTTRQEGTVGAPVPPDTGDAVRLAEGIISRYELAALHPLLNACKSAVTRKDLSIAVLGRFKAGKSSFLNHFMGRDLLPVGVVPVTSIVTEIHWGAEEAAEVRYLNGQKEAISFEAIRDFITESGNPENRKQVSNVVLRLPELDTYRALRFVDTPGLESAFTHNTEASLAWAPNVDLALVAIGVDPPLSQQDVTLIRKLFEHTPKVCVLLTKVDVLTEGERNEVWHFVRTQLNRNFDTQLPVFPYSIRPGFQELKSALEDQFIRPTLGGIREQRQEIVNHKIRTLLRECGEFVQLSLRSAEMIDAETRELGNRALGEREALSDTRLELQLAARHNIGTARNHIEKILARFEKPIQVELATALEEPFPKWRMSFARLLEQFEDWLRHALTSRLTVVSASCKADFLKPLRDVQRHYQRVLQAFRDRLSARTMELFGVPLRTTETEIEPEPPKAPDINIGRIFDHNWELLSPVLPMAVLRGAVKRRFLTRVDYETTKNLSRLTTQWADIVAEAITAMQREAERRLEDLIKTVERLTASSIAQAPEIRSDLERIREAERELQT